MKKTLVLFIDGFRKDYISKKNTPNLYALVGKYGVGELKPVFGYYSIPAAFYTGFNPDKSDTFSIYKKTDKPNLLYQIPGPNTIRSYGLNLLRFILGKNHTQPVVDSKYFKWFTFSQEYYYNKKNSLGKKTLFDIFSENDTSFISYNWPILFTDQKNGRLTPFIKNTDDNKVRKFIELVRSHDVDFYMLHLWDLDHFGHKLGIKDRGFRKMIRDQDKLIGEVLKEFDLNKDNILIWSDHGMIEVKKYVDIIKLLPPNGVGYKYFVDSTVARFWFEDEKIKEKVLNILKKIPQGHLLTEKEKKDFRVEYAHTNHFEEIFIVDPGVAIYPNFFQESAPPKAMHSYDLTDKNEYGVYIINKKVKNKGTTTDLFPTLLKMMDIPLKNPVDGKLL